MQKQSAHLQTPVGRVTVTARDGMITGLSWEETSGPAEQVPPEGCPAGNEATGDVLRQAIAQLRAYFAGELNAFSLPLDVAGSTYQQAVCAEIAAIPFGETRTYGELAQTLGSSAQAVGNACGANPIPIIIPCHRVLGGSGLGGFSGRGGVETKVSLLRHEGAAGLLI